MQNIPGYTINAKLAEGGCAQIFAGIEQSSGRKVAIKILHGRNLANKVELKRIVDEGNLGMKLKHDNLVRTYATGMSGNLPYIVLEYIKGRMLRDLIADKYLLGNVETLILAKSLCHVVRYLHDSNILHKDIKPDNIMIGERGEVKLLDLGFAEIPKTFSLFASKRLDGSPAYMAPELLLTKKASVATDIYAIGCTLYEAAAGFTPFEGMSDAETIAKQTNLKYSAPPVTQKNSRISALTEKTILRALQKDVAQRYKSIDEIMLDLARNPASNDPKSSNRLTPVTA
jgi:serine/threonine protein kinase